MAAVLPIEEHFKLQIILVDRAPLLHLIHLADIKEECHDGPFRTVPDHRTPVLTHMSTESRLEVRLTISRRPVFDQVFAILPTELVDNALEVVDSIIGIIALYGRLVELVDQILVIFGRPWLDLRFRTTTFNTIIQEFDIRQRGLR
jgi:hypothetical protein